MFLLRNVVFTFLYQTQRTFFFMLLILVSCLFISCSTKYPSIEIRKQNALNFALQNDLKEFVFNSNYFNIFSLQTKNICLNKTINIYIEGDGLAWLTKNQISDNPTPTNQTLLDILSVDSNLCKIYLARPCQFVYSSKCQSEYWTNKRFSKEIIDTFDDVLNQVKISFKNKDFNLIGYSGGGAVATLLASKRDDIKSLVTIAGNLDTNKWTDFHKISRLDGSLNPTDVTKNLSSLKQYHFIGLNDKIIPKDIFLSYLSKYQNIDNIRAVYVNSNHSCCFKDSFKKFLEENKDRFLK